MQSRTAPKKASSMTLSTCALASASTWLRHSFQAWNAPFCFVCFVCLMMRMGVNRGARALCPSSSPHAPPTTNKTKTKQKRRTEARARGAQAQLQREEQARGAEAQRARQEAGVAQVARVGLVRDERVVRQHALFCFFWGVGCFFVSLLLLLMLGFAWGGVAMGALRGEAAALGSTGVTRGV